MKALIRQENEVILETTALKFIDWSTGAPLTNPAWAGGPYTLVEDYKPPTDEEESDGYDPDEKRKAEIAELRARLAALENGN